MDKDIPPHIPDLEDFCRMCLTGKVRCTCKPMSNSSADLIDITQPALLTQTVLQIMTGMMDRTMSYPLTGVTKTTSGWVKHMTRSGPFLHWNQYQHYPFQMEMMTAIAVSTFTHTITGLRLLCKCPSKPALGRPKGIRTNPNTTPVASPRKAKDQDNIGLWITKIATISKEAFKALD